MCELFAMSSRTPARVRYSLSEFARHGGGTAKNSDGWGIVFYELRDAELFKEPSPAFGSALEALVVEHEKPSRFVMAHVRRATAGENALENTHPFRRVQGGRVHNFAHNGNLPGLLAATEGTPIERRCLGDTDSERAFVELLARRLELETDDGDLAPLGARHALFTEFCRDMIGYGDANILYCDGDALFVHAHRRVYEGEHKPRAPGLHMLSGQDISPEGDWSVSGASIAALDRQSVLFASVPVSDDPWEELPEGCALAVRDGHECFRSRTM